MGYIALFFAVSGSAVAIEDRLARDSVDNRALQTSAVDSRVIEDGGVRGRDMRALTIRNENLRSGAVDARVIKTRSIEARDIATNTITGWKILEHTLDPRVLQFRIGSDCEEGEAISAIAGNGTVTCTPTGRGTLTGVTAGLGLDGGGKTGDVKLDIDPAEVQTRLKRSCAEGEAISAVAGDGAVACTPTGKGTITGVTAGQGLTGGGKGGDVTVDVNPAQVQTRLQQSCAAGEALRGIDEDGTPRCLTPNVTGAAGGDLAGTYPNPTLAPNAVQGGEIEDGQVSGDDVDESTLDGVDADLFGGLTPPSFLLDADTLPGTSDLSGTYANPQLRAGAVAGGSGGDILDGSVTADDIDESTLTGDLQRRVTGNCTGSNAIQEVAADGSVTCAATGTGTVTSIDVASDSGLTASPAPITSAGTIGTDFDTIQRRVTGACAGASAVQSISNTGTVGCTSNFAQANAFPNVIAILSPGETRTLFDFGGIIVRAECRGSDSHALVTVGSNGGSGQFMNYSARSATVNGAGVSVPDGTSQTVVDTTTTDHVTFNAVSTAFRQLDGSLLAWSALATSGQCLFSGSAMTH